MTIRHRAMQRQDVRECVDTVAAHPIVGPRYGSAIEDLGPAWLRLLSCNGFCSAAVLEETGQAGSRIVGIGVSVFITDNFLRELKTSPLFWMSQELARRVARGDRSPLLPSKQVPEANSRGGLNLAVWQSCVRIEDVGRPEPWNEMMNAFLEYHRGFLFKEMVAQGESPQHLQGLRNTGGFLWRPGEKRYGEFDAKPSLELLSEPHLAGLPRDMALKQLGSWLSTLFHYELPRFGFSVSEQRLLLSALAGGTDEQLSDDLGISFSAVKKTWRSIYDRVAACLPELIPNNSQLEGEASKRGKDKKQRLISYLREHPQELRPVSRNLLQQRPVRGQGGIHGHPA
jgi:hypothetical protein